MQLIGKNKNHWNCSYVDKKWCGGSDPDGSLYPSSAGMLSVILNRFLKTPPMDIGCGKHTGTNSIYCPGHNSVHEYTAFAPSTPVWPYFSATSHSYHFGPRFLVTTWSNILQLLQTCAEIWVQFCSCPECWVHPVRCWWCWRFVR